MAIRIRIDSLPPGQDLSASADGGPTPPGKARARRS